MSSERIANLSNCVSANYGSAMSLKKRIEEGKSIKPDDFDLNMIIDRSYLYLKKTAEDQHDQS